MARRRRRIYKRPPITRCACCGAWSWDGRCTTRPHVPEPQETTA